MLMVVIGIVGLIVVLGIFLATPFGNNCCHHLLDRWDQCRGHNYLGNSGPERRDDIKREIYRVLEEAAVEKNEPLSEQELSRMLHCVRELNTYRCFKRRIPDHVLATPATFEEQWVLPKVEQIRQRDISNIDFETRVSML